MRHQHVLRLCPLLIGILATTGCGSGSAVATLTYDLGGDTTLYSYAPVPATVTRDIERIAQRSFQPDARSPATIYNCVWSTADRSGLTTKQATQPEELMISCMFGTSAWTPPSSPIEESEKRRKRAESLLRLRLKRSGNGYRVSAFHLEMRDPDKSLHFMSSNDERDLPGLDLRLVSVMFLETPKDSLSFELSGSVPQRSSSGDNSTMNIMAKFSVSGTASPTPTWLVYPGTVLRN